MVVPQVCEVTVTYTMATQWPRPVTDRPHQAPSDKCTMMYRHLLVPVPHRDQGRRDRKAGLAHNSTRISQACPLSLNPRPHQAHRPPNRPGWRCRCHRCRCRRCRKCRFHRCRPRTSLTLGRRLRRRAIYSPRALHHRIQRLRCHLTKFALTSRPETLIRKSSQPVDQAPCMRHRHRQPLSFRTPIVEVPTDTLKDLPGSCLQRPLWASTLR